MSNPYQLVPPGALSLPSPRPSGLLGEQGSLHLDPALEAEAKTILLQELERAFQELEDAEWEEVRRSIRHSPPGTIPLVSPRVQSSPPWLSSRPRGPSYYVNDTYGPLTGGRREAMRYVLRAAMKVPLVESTLKRLKQQLLGELSRLWSNPTGWQRRLFRSGVILAGAGALVPLALSRQVRDITLGIAEHFPVSIESFTHIPGGSVTAMRHGVELSAYGISATLVYRPRRDRLNRSVSGFGAEASLEYQPHETLRIVFEVDVLEILRRAGVDIHF